MIFGPTRVGEYVNNRIHGTNHSRDRMPPGEDGLSQPDTHEKRKVDLSRQKRQTERQERRKNGDETVVGHQCGFYLIPTFDPVFSALL